MTGALGTSTLALILSEKKNLTPLAIDGVMPSVQTITDKSYPYFKPMYLVTKGAPTGAAERFIEFVRSPAGRRILTDNGHWVTD